MGILFLLINYYYSILKTSHNFLEGPADSDDEKIRNKSQGSLVEFRRLKRILLAKKKKIIFQKTPTPNDFDRNSRLHDVLFNNLRTKNLLLFNKTKDNLIPNYVSNNIFYLTDSLICDADFYELELIRQFISEKKKYFFIKNDFS